MNLTVRGIRYNPSDETREFLDKKLQKLQFAEGFLHDLDIVMTRETAGQGFHLDAKIHFSWGTVKMVSTDCYELYGESNCSSTDRSDRTGEKQSKESRIIHREKSGQVMLRRPLPLSIGPRMYEDRS